MNKNKFSKYTYKIISKLPHWFKVRQNPEVTTSGNFLNIIGMSYDELESIINYIYKQSNLLSADEEELNFVYKGFIPGNIKEKDFSVFSSQDTLKEIKDVKKFFRVSNDALKFPELKIDNPYYIDYESNIIYTKKSYDYNIFLDLEDKTYDIELSNHKIWNIFDEFGYWFGLERNPNEDNHNYKERLLDIFRNRGNSSGKGLANALSRELDLRENRVWQNGGEDLVLKEPMIIYNNIKVDGKEFPEENIRTNKEYDVILKGNPSFEGISRTVSYIAGIEIKELNNKNDTTIYHRMHTIEGTASEIKKEYAKEINSTVPLGFNTVKSDVNNWDIGSVENTDKGVIETISDVPIQSFIKYGVIEREFIDNIDKNYQINTWGDIKAIGTWEDVKETLKTWKDVLISEG